MSDLGRESDTEIHNDRIKKYREKYLPVLFIWHVMDRLIILIIFNPSKKRGLLVNEDYAE